MATLGRIRQGIDDTIEHAIPSIHGYNEVKDVVNCPAMVVMPARETADFNGAMGRGMDTWRFDVFVLVQRGESSVAQRQLDAYVSGSGDMSLRAVFFENADLGIGDGTDANVDGVREYGGKFQTARIDHVGAIVRLTVRTPGK